jgi:molecular chaperone Hsp33
VSDVELKGSVVVQRYMDRDHGAIISRADFRELFRAYLDHVMLWEGKPPDGLVEVMMRQALAAGTLHLATKRRGEQVAWTLNVAEPPLNVFVTGDNERCMITGRAFTEDVRTVERSRFFVETRRGEESFRSVIEVSGLDVLGVFDQFYVQSEQRRGRFYELSDTVFMMVFGLPVAGPDWVESIELEQARSLDLGTLQPLDTLTYWFQCGCDPEQMLRAVRAIYHGKIDELFQEDERIVLACPRCGRRWPISRERFQDPGPGLSAGPGPSP